jgi:hypothetical protein
VEPEPVQFAGAVAREVEYQLHPLGDRIAKPERAGAAL